MLIRVGIVSVFMPFNFAVFFDSRNLRNKGHANIKGFSVVELCKINCFNKQSFVSDSSVSTPLC